MAIIYGLNSLGAPEGIAAAFAAEASAWPLTPRQARRSAALDEFIEGTRAISSLLTAAMNTDGRYWLCPYSQSEFEQLSFGTGISSSQAGKRLNSIAGLISSARCEILPYYEEYRADPRAKISELFGTDVQNEPKIEIFGCALVAQLEGWDYGRIAKAHRFIEPGSGIKSYGTTLFAPDSCEIPESLHGRFVLVNEGDGYFGSRAPAAIAVTRQHEISHVIFNTCFRLAPCPDTSVAARVLEELTDPGDIHSHVSLASNFALSMSELARSEIIAYASTGTLKFDQACLRGALWDRLEEIIADFIDANSEKFLDQEAITAVYESRRAWCDLKVERYKENAIRLYDVRDTNPRLSRDERTAVLYQLPVEEAGLIEHLLPEPYSLSA